MSLENFSFLCNFTIRSLFALAPYDLVRKKEELSSNEMCFTYS